METKKINRLMLGTFLFYIVVVIVLLSGEYTMAVEWSLSLGELILLAPTLVYLICFKWKSGKESLRNRLHFHKIKWSTVVYVILFTWMSMPLTSLINGISQFFVDNTVLSMSETILRVSFPMMLFLMAVLPACVEEVLYRGVVYGGYRKTGRKFAAVMLSGLMFGIMHMNLNQAMYAFVLGILLALLFEATGSIFATMLFHFIYNAQSCCMMYLTDLVDPEYYEALAETVYTQDQLFASVSFFIVLAAVFTPLAFCMLYKIAKNENRVSCLKECLPGKRQEKEKIVTVSYVLATIVAVGYIVFDIVVSKMMG